MLWSALYALSTGRNISSNFFVIFMTRRIRIVFKKVRVILNFCECCVKDELSNDIISSVNRCLCPEFKKISEILYWFKVRCVLLSAINQVCFLLIQCVIGVELWEPTTVYADAPPTVCLCEFSRQTHPSPVA